MRLFVALEKKLKKFYNYDKEKAKYMSPISSIDTSIYSGLIESLQPATGRQVPVAASGTPTQASIDTPVDLNNYYSNLSSSNLLVELGQNVAQSADALDSAMVAALENGMTVQDACNINAALHAYQANCVVLQSTFELKI